MRRTPNRRRPVVSARVRKNGPLLIALHGASRATRNAALKTASKDLVLALVECAKNIILGNVRLTPSQLNELRGHRQDIEALVRGSSSLTHRKRILQKGGFLGMLVKPILGLLGGILGGGGGGGLFGGGKR
jgi:hypothetical protein